MPLKTYVNVPRLLAVIVPLVPEPQLKNGSVKDCLKVHCSTTYLYCPTTVRPSLSCGSGTKGLKLDEIKSNDARIEAEETSFFLFVKTWLKE